MFTSVYRQVRELLQQKPTTVITAHKSPDGDAIGSALALQHVLQAAGIDSTVVVPDAFPHFLHWMKGASDIVIFDQQEKLANEQLAKAELIFCLDYNVPTRVGNAMKESLMNASAKYVLIDHHQNPDTFPDVVISDTTASSTAQLVFDFIHGIGFKEYIDVAVAECLYAGLLTDTGSFRFPSTSVHTHEVVAELMKIGLDVSKVYQAIYDTNSLNRLRLLGYCLSEKLTVMDGFHAAYISLSKEDMDRFGYQKGDTEGVVNYALSIDGVRFACIMKQYENEIRMSFRSKGDVDVNLMAREYFEGGGHRNAAGGVSHDSLEDTLSRVKTMVKNHPMLAS